MASVLAYHWDFLESTGSSTFASRKTANIATKAGTVTAEVAGFGNLGKQVTIGTSGKLSLAAEITTLTGVLAISFWFEVDDVDNDHVYFMGKNTTDYIRLTTGGTDFKIKVASSGAPVFLDIDTPLASATRYHVVIRRAADNEWDLWINNVLQTQTSSPTAMAGTFAVTHIHGTATVAGMTTGGKLNDIRIYTTALSDDNVEALYEMGVYPTPVPLADLRHGLVRGGFGDDTPDIVKYFNGDDGGGGLTMDLWTEVLSNQDDDGFDTEHTPYAGVTQHQRFIHHDDEDLGANSRETWPGTQFDLTDGTGVAPEDMKAGVVEMYFPPGTLVDRTDRDSISGLAALKEIQLHLYDETLGNPSSSTIYSPNQERLEGYKQFPIGQNESQWDVAATHDGVRRILFKSDWNTGARKSLVFNRMAFYPQPTGAARSRFFFRFDDALDEHITRANSATVNSIKCAFAIITGNIGNGGSLTMANLATMYGDDHGLFNHVNEGIAGNETGSIAGWQFPDSSKLEYTSFAIRVTGAVGGRDDLINWGYPEFSRALIAPGGYPNPGNKTSQSDEQLIVQGYVDSIWYAGAGNPGWSAVAPRSDNVGEHNWGVRATYTMDASQTTPTAPQLQTKLDEIIGTGTDPELSISAGGRMEEMASLGGDIIMYAHDEVHFPEASWAKVMTKALTLQTNSVATIGEPSDIFLPHNPQAARGMSMGLGMNM